MKKIYALFVLILITFSCSESDDFSSDVQSKQPIKTVTRLDPTRLARVIFYPGTNHERYWVFNGDGLLKKIVLPNGTLIQNFVYDTNRNLINTQFFGDPFFIVQTPYNYTFTYDANNRVSSINGNAISYNPITNSYSQGTWSWLLNSESLLTSEFYVYTHNDIDNNGNPITVTETVNGLSVGYVNNNLAGNREFNSPSGTHYHHDTNLNPFKTALLPICRVLQFTHFNSAFGKWVEGEYTSQNNIIKRYYDSGDPESDVFEYTYNSNNLPVSQIRKSYYFTALEQTTLDILYYYQGDAIP